MLLLIILVLPLVISTSDLNLPHVTFDQNAQKITLKKINILNKQGEDSTFVINKSYELPAFGKFIKIKDGKATFSSEFETKVFDQKQFTQLLANEICVTKVSDHTDAYNIGFLHCENGDIMDTKDALIQKKGDDSKPQMSGEDGRDEYLKLVSYIPCVDYLPAYNTYTTCQKAHTAFKARKAAKSYIRYRSTWGANTMAVGFDFLRGGNQPIRFYWNKNADKRNDGGVCGIRDQTNDENEAFWKKIFEKVKMNRTCESVCRSIIQGATKTNTGVNKHVGKSSVSGNAASCDKPIPTEIKKTIKNCPTLTTHGQNQLCYHP
eukprot:488950_1